MVSPLVWGEQDERMRVEASQLVGANIGIGGKLKSSPCPSLF